MNLCKHMECKDSAHSHYNVELKHVEDKRQFGFLKLFLQVAQPGVLRKTLTLQPQYQAHQT